MKKFNFQLFMVIIMMFVLSCTSQKKASLDDDFSTESAASDSVAGDNTDLEGDLNLDSASNEAVSEKSGAAATDEFAEFNDAPTPPVAKNTGEDDLEKELNQLDGGSPAPVGNNTPPPSEIPIENPVAAQQPVPPPVIDSPPPPEIVQNQAAPIAPTPEIQQEASVVSSQAGSTSGSQNEVSQINSVQYQSNQSGGTVVINSSQPLQFTTRLNSATNQLIVEVQNSVIPKKLKRTLNTKDMASSIGSVDIYQKPNSKVSRFVVQLRPGSSEPLVQPEGTSLLIVGAPNQSYAKNNPSAASKSSESNQNTSNSQGNNPDSSQPQNEGSTQSKSGGSGATLAQNSDVNPDLTSEGIMNSQNLEDFLASNNKFYGKKISIETPKLDINEAFRFLAEESNVNMIIDEGIRGDVSLKLRQVPWDQAFVLLLKTKKLGYKRQGSVIRIASIETLLKEEDEAIKLVEARRGTQPLTVKRFFIGYADIGDLEKKIKDFITSNVITATGQSVSTPSRGKVISDTRTSSLIVTETPENISKIEKLIAALDSQPKQVLIEGKVVEASEKFVRGLGVNWTTTEASPGGNLIRPSLSFKPDLGSTIFNPTFGLGAIGRPGDLGNLTATLSLGEREDKVRILSSPRISVLSNQAATISQTVNVSIDKVSTAATTGAVTTSIEQVPVGVTLKVTPQVSNEGTVVMDLDIERSFQADAKSSGIEKRNAKTKVIVRSGQTAVIGGIFQADATESVSGIPFLRNIPVFGLLFKGTQTTKNKNELVIFVTPRIQKTVQGEASTVTNVE